jgi:hypothetical protein
MELFPNYYHIIFMLIFSVEIEIQDEYNHFANGAITALRNKTKLASLLNCYNNLNLIAILQLFLYTGKTKVQRSGTENPNFLRTYF